MKERERELSIGAAFAFRGPLGWDGMRGRKHPLEIYQRGRPFGSESRRRRAAEDLAYSDPLTDRGPPAADAPAALEGDGWLPRCAGKLRRGLAQVTESLARRVAAWPPGAQLAGAGAGVLLLLLAAYAVGFRPEPGTGEPGDRGSVNEWRHPRAEQRLGGGDPTPSWTIQVARGPIPASGRPGHEVARDRWLEQEETWQDRVESEWPGSSIPVEAVYLPREDEFDVRLILGSWSARDDPELLDVLMWLQERGQDPVVLSR